MKRLRILPIILVVSLVSILILGALPAILSACPIDIKPGSNPNSINLGANGVVPVAVLLTSADFKGLYLDPSTVKFAGASAVKWAIEDVDGDGILDMIFHFNIQDTDLIENSTYALLTGIDIWGGYFAGGDSVNIVPKKK